MVIRSHYFEPRDIQLEENDLVVVTCMRNEAARLPYFLEYYRARGVDRFLCVDNGSTDGTTEILAAQPDVELFRTTGSYRGSAAGRLWMQELADTYTTGHWTLTVDVDELLVYPGSEKVPLKMLCRYLDRRGYEGLFTVMLDMYSDKPFAETRYTPGAPFLDTCGFFETDSYTLRPQPNPPFFNVFGGPRGRLYARATENDPGPTMKKVPLVKWMPGFSYIRSTHTHRYVPLADITGALLHFKFFASFAEGMVAEYRRGDRRQNHVYATYVDNIGPDTCFHGPHSHRYRSPSDLVGRGVMTSSRGWQRYCGRISERRKHPFDVDALLPVPPAAPEGLEKLATTWPFANNPGIASYFGLSMPGRNDPRAELMAELVNHIDLVEIEEDRVLLHIGEPALHRWQRNGLAAVLTVEGRVVGTVAVDGTDEVLELVQDSMEPNVCEWPLDVLAALDGAPSANVTVHLVDTQNPDRACPATGDLWTAAEEDALLFSGVWHASATTSTEAGEISGRLERLADGSVTGRVRAGSDGRVPINVYVNGRLAVHTSTGSDETGADDESFSVAIPIGYLVDHGAEEITVHVRAAGTNVSLERSPLVFAATSRDAVWHDQAGWTSV